MLQRLCMRRNYLPHCTRSKEAYEDFLDSSFLGCRQVSIREYLASNPTIMTEQVTLPPGCRYMLD
jgi:hypothetical protein